MRGRSAALWAAVLLVFVGGDVGTTLYGLHVAGAVEGHPVSAVVLQSFGLLGMLGAKVIVVLAALTLSRLPRNAYVRVSSPLTLLLVGTFLTTWNTVVILALT
ncbi:hypothetical protein M197_gp54 [Haloarcula hispanica tailed virus 2]|uniref:DUF5658 domain-containing protein n=1 Tax=Haloarcula hispanica tailed virus 2 TaxID=1273751 RepID=R4T6A3_9CAUD|nr:hypothetical protein M197_gp54 [Haloarcula hispanica tailed virus 2]AGM11219.1 hypothetical protein HHTV2_54 [Haloarcula hispanica tailed virus 2]